MFTLASFHKLIEFTGIEEKKRYRVLHHPGLPRLFIFFSASVISFSLAAHGCRRVPRTPDRSPAEGQASCGGENKAPKTHPRLTSVRNSSRTRDSATLPARPRESKSRAAKPRGHILLTTSLDRPRMPAKNWPLKAPQLLVREGPSSGRGQCP